MLGNPRNCFVGWGGGVGIPESWDLESKIPRKIEIRNPSSTDKDLESSTEYLELGIQNTRLHWIPCLMGLIEGPINNRRKSKTVVITCQLKIKKNKKKQNNQFGIKSSRRIIACAIIVDEQYQEHGSVQEVNQWFLSQYLTVSTSLV